MPGELPFLVIFALDFIAFALALAAEQTRNTAKVLADAEMNYLYCVYDSKIATVFGAIASTILFASQASQCFCFRKVQRHEGSGSCYSIALTIICWATFLIAEACLIWGAVSNSQETKYRSIYSSGNVNCHTLRKGVFEAAAGFIMIESLLFSMSRTCHSKVKEEFLCFRGSNDENGEYNLMLVTSSG